MCSESGSIPSGCRGPKGRGFGEGSLQNAATSAPVMLGGWDQELEEGVGAARWGGLQGQLHVFDLHEQPWGSVDTRVSQGQRSS